MSRCKRCYHDEHQTEKAIGFFSLGRLGGCGIEVDADKKTLQVILLNSDVLEILYEAKIKYCPICGRKL